MKSPAIEACMVYIRAHHRIVPVGHVEPRAERETRSRSPKVALSNLVLGSPIDNITDSFFDRRAGLHQAGHVRRYV